MDDVKLAMLGNKDAAKRLTDAGVLVPCPMCRDVICMKCFTNSGWYKTEHEARLAWNTRAPILSAEEIQKLEENT